MFLFFLFDCGIGQIVRDIDFLCQASSVSIRSLTCTFGHISLVKPPFLQLWVKKLHSCSSLLASVLLCPVMGRSRLAVIACCTVRSGVFHHWIHHLWPRGAVPPGFNPLRRGWVYRPAPEAPRKGECRRGPRHFWNCLSRWATALRQDPP